MALFVSADEESRNQLGAFQDNLEPAERVEVFLSPGTAGEFVFLTTGRMGLWDTHQQNVRFAVDRADIAMISRRDHGGRGSELHIRLIDGSEEQLVGQWDQKKMELTSLLALVFSRNLISAAQKFGHLDIEHGSGEDPEPKPAQYEAIEQPLNSSAAKQALGVEKREVSGIPINNTSVNQTSNRPKAFQKAKTNKPDLFQDTKTLGKLGKHLSDGDDVEVIIWSPGSGYLLSTQDRCIIAKISLAQSFMAGSLGGGRVASFYHADINSIEYNSGLFNGVLEILTASYQGSANKDFWQGTFRSRNANSNDPYTLSNTLPLARFEYEELKPLISIIRSRISKTKNPARIDKAPSNSMDSLDTLSHLHDTGKLSDEEFAAAKARVLGLEP